jgi:HAD superfamily hydrolase (TIGR01509 family)
MIPYREIQTLSLDVGNTLISIDFPRISSELQVRGFTISPRDLRRAEAASRPTFSSRMGKASGKVDYSFGSYLETVLSHADSSQSPGREEIGSLAADLADALETEGQANRIWRWVLPGVPEALENFRSLGLQLVALSNSDGSAELSLKEAGLRNYFSTVIDSAIVGYEKPDPRIFEHALSASGARKESTLHVGDLYHPDVEGARDAGLYALLLDPFGDWQLEDCESLPDLSALAAVLREARDA